MKNLYEHGWAHSYWSFSFRLCFAFTLLRRVRNEEIPQHTLKGFGSAFNLLATSNSTVSIWLRFHRFSRGLRSALLEDFQHSKFSGLQRFIECCAKVLIKVLIKNGFWGEKCFSFTSPNELPDFTFHLLRCHLPLVNQWLTFVQISNERFVIKQSHSLACWNSKKY